MDQAKTLLVNRIGKILGAEAAESIAEFASTLDVKADNGAALKEYLSDLLGSGNEASDITSEYCRFRSVSSTRNTNSDMVLAKSALNTEFHKLLRSTGESNTWSTECGCMGTKHDLIGSCSFCGRVYCKMEMRASHSDKNSSKNVPTDKQQIHIILGYCYKCRHAVLPPLSADDMASHGADETTVRAYKQKVQQYIYYIRA